MILHMGALVSPEVRELASRTCLRAVRLTAYDQSASSPIEDAALVAQLDGAAVSFTAVQRFGSSRAHYPS